MDNLQNKKTEDLVSDSFDDDYHDATKSLEKNFNSVDESNPKESNEYRQGKIFNNKTIYIYIDIVLSL